MVVLDIYIDLSGLRVLSITIGLSCLFKFLGLSVPPPYCAFHFFGCVHFTYPGILPNTIDCMSFGCMTQVNSQCSQISSDDEASTFTQMVPYSLKV